MNSERVTLHVTRLLCFPCGLALDSGFSVEYEREGVQERDRGRERVGKRGRERGGGERGLHDLTMCLWEVVSADLDVQRGVKTACTASSAVSSGAFQHHPLYLVTVFSKTAGERGAGGPARLEGKTC